MKIQFSKADLPKSGVVVFPVAESLKFSQKLIEIDDANGNIIKKAAKSSNFTGKKGKYLSVFVNDDNFERIILAGVGKQDSANGDTEGDIQSLGASISNQLNHLSIKNAVIVIEEPIGGFSTDFVAANMAYGAKLRRYSFDKYKTKQEDDKKPALKGLTFNLHSSTEASAKYKNLEKIADGVFLARDVVSEPPNILQPVSYAEKCKELKSLGIKVDVLGEKEMRKLGMEALLGVGQGSVHESQLVVMHWNGAPKKDTSPPIAFVGKGVTFDTGGISLKPSLNMDEMKYDMGGSGAVVGLMKALAGRKAAVNVVGVVGLVENMPAGNAQRPGDVVTSMSGQTIEVLNTDAEGRLVLADALWYVQDKFKPKFIVDLATLTGAIVMALGSHRAGLFSNNDELSERLLKAGDETGEKLWRLPLGDEYDKQIDSKVADVQNISNAKGAGSITAAQFLKRFVNDVPWAHLDIAGTAWTKKGLDLVPEGATGYGVRLLDRFVSDNYEN